MDTYLTLLKSYSGRDKVLRTVAYTAVFVSGSFKGKINKDLVKIAGQLSATRTVLRLFDDLPMLLTTKASFNSPERDFMTKALNILGNISILVFYPCEKIAWLADNEVLPIESYRWWKGGVACWAVFLVFGILKNIRRILLLKKKLSHLVKSRKLELPDTPEGSDTEIRAAVREMKGEYVSIIKNAADLVMAVNFLPAGFLWAEKISAPKTAFFGVISSILGTAMFLQQEAAAKKEAKRS